MTFFFNENAGVAFVDPDDDSIRIHTSDFGLKYLTANIPTAEPKIQSVDVPGRDGVLDLTEANGKEFIRYYSRKIEIVLLDTDYGWGFDQKISKLKREIHGKRKKIILDRDPGYYLLGRIISFSDVERSGDAGQITITAEVDPFKYSIHKSDDDWLWDPFCFETDYVPDGANITVKGSATVEIFAGDQSVIPTIISSANMTLKLRDNTFSIKSGTQKNNDIIFYSGYNRVTFTGNGNVSVKFERKFF